MTSVIHVAGWTLVHFVWQGALLGLAAAAALRSLRSMSARTRYIVACAALVAMVVTPVITVRLLSDSHVVGAQINPSRSEASYPAASDAIMQSVVQSAASSRLSMQAIWLGLDTILPLVVTAWFGGVALLLIRLAGGWWRVRRMHLDSLARASRWQTVSDRIASRLGVHQGVHVVDSPLVDTPTALGWLRPAVLLPIAALANLTPAQVEAILAHELAHIRRHDYVVNVLQAMAETLLFYHPAVWWVSARIRAEREHCCDDVAVSACGDAIVYASALAELEASRMTEPSAFALAATGGGRLIVRIGRVLQVPMDRNRSSSVAAFVALVMVVTVVVAGRHLAAFQSNGTPAQFEVASIKPNKSGERGSAGGRKGDRFTATNVTLFQLIRNAYRLRDSQVVGGPTWMTSDRFDIVAKVSASQATPENMKPQSIVLWEMLQSLIADRFNVTFHHETRELTEFSLVLARADHKLGPSLQPASAAHADCGARGAAPSPFPASDPFKAIQPCGMMIGRRAKGGHLGIRGQTMDQLTQTLATSLQVNPIVLNGTNLEGAFNIDLEWSPEQVSAAPDGPPASSSDAPPLFTALQEQLGLKLVSAKGPVDVLVIDHAEHPTEKN